MENQSSPLTEGQLVGFIPDEDKYIVYSEYYGDGTIYGRREVFGADGQPISGKGKSVRQLIELGATVSESCIGAIGGALLQVPLDPTPEWVPLALGMNVGYVNLEHRYVVYSEYYGDGTIYGRREIKAPSGSPIKAKGKSVKDLIKIGALVSTQVAGSTNGALEVVPVENAVAGVSKRKRFPSSKRRRPRGPGVN